MPITVFVVDDHPLVRDGIVQVLKLESDIQVVGEGTGSAEAIEAVRQLRPQVVLVDLEMPGIRGADFIDLLRQENLPCRILVCTMHGSHGHVAEALRRGADGYLLKTSPSGLLVEGIRTVAAGRGFIDPALQTDVIRLLQDHDQRLLATDLTAPEVDVLRLAAEGLSNHEIARRTRQSIETVKLRLRRTFQKLGAVDRANAVAVAIRRNLI